MQFKATLDKFTDNPIYSYHIKIPDNVSANITSQNTRRIVCDINGIVNYKCALMPDGNKSFFITIKKEHRTKLNISEGAELEITITKDESDGLELPEELEVLLDQDEEGNHYFTSLTPGKQRSLIHLVAAPKQSDTRLKKALVIINYLKETQGKLDYKELNTAFKMSNR